MSIMSNRPSWVVILQCVACVTDDQDAEVYPYGITSLTDKRDFLQKGDAVKFQIAAHRRTGLLRAVNIAAIRKFTRARVDSVKGQVMLLSFLVSNLHNVYHYWKDWFKRDFFWTGAISIFYGCFMDIYWIPIFIDFIVELKLFVHRNAIFD